MFVFKARRKSPTLTPDLTASQKRMVGYFVEAATATRREIAGDLNGLASRISRESAEKIANSVPVGPWIDAQQSIQDELLAELLDGGSRVVIPVMRKAVFSFDRDRPEAAAWAAREAGNLIVQVTEDQRALVRDLVSGAALGDKTPLEVARSVRDSIGLTAEQSGWVNNRWDREYQSRILGGATLAEANAGANRATDLYYDRTLRYRSETIARTEILRATHEGRREAWSQGISDGSINPGAMKQWDTVNDPCPECAAMAGVQAPITGDFPMGDPPLHPNCRCDVLLVDEIPQDITEMTDEELDAEIERLMSGDLPEPETEEEGLQVPQDLLDGGDPEAITDWGRQYVDDTLESGGGTADENRSMRGYRGVYFEIMNANLRDGSYADDPRNAPMIRDAGILADAIGRSRGLTAPLQLSRGLSTNPGFVKGEVFTERGFLSTTLDPTVADDFSIGTGSVIMRITAPAGSRAAIGEPFESEVVFAPRTRMRIKDVQEIGGNFLVTAVIEP